MQFIITCAQLCEVPTSVTFQIQSIQIINLQVYDNGLWTLGIMAVLMCSVIIINKENKWERILEILKFSYLSLNTISAQIILKVTILYILTLIEILLSIKYHPAISFLPPFYPHSTTLFSTFKKQRTSIFPLFPHSLCLFTCNANLSYDPSSYIFL